MLDVVKNKNNMRRGFTIVELLVVIVIIGILATIAVVSYNGVTKRAKQASVESEAAQLRKKLALYNAENGDYPTEKQFNPETDPTCSDDANFCFNGQYPVTYSCYDTGTCGFEIWTDPDDIDNNGECDAADCGSGSGGQVDTQTGIGTINLTPPSDCPAGFIPVPGSAEFNQKGFCVMKYEAKNVGGKATSQVSLVPWRVTQDLAMSYSNAACSGCHLISESEWMTIASNALGVSSNWYDNAGKNRIYNGNSSTDPGDALAADYAGSYNGERRTLTLSNGEQIWDFAGNEFEWTSATLTQDKLPTSGAGFFFEWNNLATLNLNGLSKSSTVPQIAKDNNWSSENGIGSLVISPAPTVGTYGYVRSGAADGTTAKLGLLHLGFLKVASANGFRVTR